MKGHLESIKNALNKPSYRIEKKAATQTIEFNHLIVNFASNEDAAKAGFKVMISILYSKELEQVFPSGDSYDLVQTLYLFPIPVERQYLADVIRLMNLLNKSVVLSGFGFDEVEKRCFFRYSYPLMKNAPDYEAFAKTFQLIEDILQTYGPTISEVIVGTASLRELLHQFDSEFNKNIEDLKNIIE